MFFTFYLFSKWEKAYYIYDIIIIFKYWFFFTIEKNSKIDGNAWKFKEYHYQN